MPITCASSFLASRSRCKFDTEPACGAPPRQSAGCITVPAPRSGLPVTGEHRCHWRAVAILQAAPLTMPDARPPKCRRAEGPVLLCSPRRCGASEIANSGLGGRERPHREGTTTGSAASRRLSHCVGAGYVDAVTDQIIAVTVKCPIVVVNMGTPGLRPDSRAVEGRGKSITAVGAL